MLKVVSAFAILSVGFLIAQAVHPLTKGQIEQLIAVLPDKTLAGEVRKRGTDFRVERPELERLKEIGAGTETIAALTELLSNARVVITSVPPNCDVALNGHAFGKTDDTGKLVIFELDAGRSELVISKDGYRTRTYDVELASSKVAELEAQLYRVTGYLSVSVVPEDALVVVNPTHLELGVDSSCRASTSARNVFECPPGDYIVTASREGFQAVTESARVSEEQKSSLSLSLLRAPTMQPSEPKFIRKVPQPPRGPMFPAETSVELKTDGDRRGTLMLSNGRIQYRDEGLGSAGKGSYGPDADNNFTLLCSQIDSVKAYGFRPTLFGSFDVVITSRAKLVGIRDSPAPGTIRLGVGIKQRHKFHIPAVNSAFIAKAIQERCGINPGSDRER